MSAKNWMTKKIFLKLWIPAIISSVGWALSDIADAVVVGNRMGTVGLAAIGLILPVYMVNCMIAHGFGIGGSVKYSKLLGSGKAKEAVKSFNLTTQGAMAVSIITAIAGNIFMTPLLKLLGTVPADGELFIATRDYLRVFITSTPLFYMSNLFNYYLRNDDNGKLAGVGSVVGNISDIMLNIVFVLVLGTGTRGAALATSAGQIIAIAIYSKGIIGNAHILQLKRIKPSFKYSFEIFREGFSASSSYMFQLVFLLICNRILIRTGSTTAVAVFDMVQNTSYLILYLYEGTNRAMQPLVSTYHGEHREDGKREARSLAFIYGGAAGMCSAVFIFLFPQLICSLFGVNDPEAVKMGINALRLFSASTIFAGASILSAGYFQSCEREKESMFITSLRGGIVLLPVSILFALLGISWFWWLFIATEAVALLVWIIALYSKKTTAEQLDMWQGKLLGNINDIARLTAEVEEFCESKGASIKQTYYVTMTIEELCVAIIQNGFADMRKCYIEITLVAEKNNSFSLHIRDNATSFNPFSLSTQKVTEDGDFDMDAMGVMVIKKQAKNFFYRRYGGFNSLVVNI